MIGLRARLPLLMAQTSARLTHPTTMAIAAIPSGAPDCTARSCHDPTSVAALVVSSHTFDVRQARDQVYRRLSRGFCFVLLGAAIAFLVAAAVKQDVRLVFAAMWPGAVGTFGVIAFKPGATKEWIAFWWR